MNALQLLTRADDPAPRHRDGIASALAAIELALDPSIRPDAPALASSPAPSPATRATLADLIDECLALCGRRPACAPEPLRTLHHFACSGGTLISKCVAAMPNVQLLSEVDPLGTLADADRPAFTPTDMNALLRHSSRGASREMLIGLFREQIRFIHRQAQNAGQQLVIRDHAHGHFCRGPEVRPRPNLCELLPEGLPQRSVLTVRHPLDAFASLQASNWVHFEPRTIDEYCRRHLLFLDSYGDVPWLRYEAFVADPAQAMRQICGWLDLGYAAHFPQTFPAFRLSGDSGRSGDRIAARASSAAAVALQDEAFRSAHYRQLIQRLGYGSAAGEWH